MARVRDLGRRPTPRPKETHRPGDEGSGGYFDEKAVNPHGKSSHEQAKRFKDNGSKLSGDRWRNRGF